jgi:hypothetical protein
LCSTGRRAEHDAVLSEARNVVLVAPQGLGKTMIVQNIAHQVILSADLRARQHALPVRAAHGGSAEVAKVRDAFDRRFEELMTDLVRGKQNAAAPSMTPSRPVAFSADGLIFRWEPATIPLSFSKRDR